MTWQTSVSIILTIGILLTITGLSITISFKNKSIALLESKLLLAETAVLHQNSQIEALKINKEDLLLVLNQANRDVENLRNKISLMPNNTCQDKLKIIDSIYKEISR